MLKKKFENGIIFINYDEKVDLVMINMSWNDLNNTQAGHIGFSVHKKVLKELVNVLNDFFSK